MKLQLTIQQLEAILTAAKESINKNKDCSHTIEIEQIKECDTHTGGDQVKARVRSVYSECNSFEIY
jgi:hypothetical protein